MPLDKNILALRGILVPARISSGKTQAAFAISKGFAVGTWQAWEQGRYQPNFKELVKICEILPSIAKDVTATLLPGAVPRFSEAQLIEMAKPKRTSPRSDSTKVKAGVLNGSTKS